MAMNLNVLLFNFRDGGLNRPAPDGLTLPRRAYDFSGLAQIMRLVDLPTAEPGEAPHIIGICEAKGWEQEGTEALAFVEEIFYEVFRRPYVGLIGSNEAGSGAPALFYDASALGRGTWGDPYTQPVKDKRNLGIFFPHGQPQMRFGVLIDHWPYQSGPARLERAKVISRYGEMPTPTLLIGDLNGIASGPHFDRRSWNNPGLTNRQHKGKQLADGTWIADTDALDLLIGKWNEETRSRVGGTGWYACEEADGVPAASFTSASMPTTNRNHGPEGESLHIDWMLHNAAWRGGVVPKSMRVLVPPPSLSEVSDHRLFSCTMRLGATSDATIAS